MGEEGFTAALMTDAHTGTFVDGTGPIEVLDEVTRNVRRDRPEFVIAWCRLGPFRPTLVQNAWVDPDSLTSFSIGAYEVWTGAGVV